MTSAISGMLPGLRGLDDLLDQAALDDLVGDLFDDRTSRPFCLLADLAAHLMRPRPVA